MEYINLDDDSAYLKSVEELNENEKENETEKIKTEGGTPANIAENKNNLNSSQIKKNLI